jgi:hypothetical protein
MPTTPLTISEMKSSAAATAPSDDVSRAWNACNNRFAAKAQSHSRAVALVYQVIACINQIAGKW